MGLELCLYADALTLVSAESKDFESGWGGGGGNSILRHECLQAVEVDANA